MKSILDVSEDNYSSIEEAMLNNLLFYYYYTIKNLEGFKKVSYFTVIFFSESDVGA